jgi:hypothetical protein
VGTVSGHAAHHSEAADHTELVIDCNYGEAVGCNPGVEGCCSHAEGAHCNLDPEADMGCLLLVVRRRIGPRHSVVARTELEADRNHLAGGQSRSNREKTWLSVKRILGRCKESLRQRSRS